MNSNQKSFSIDAHFDLGGIIKNRRKKGQSNILETEFFKQLHKAHFKLVIAAVFIETDMTDLALREALLQIQAVKDDINESLHFVLVKTKDDLKALRNSDKIGILLSLEGAEPIHREISLLDVFYDLGVRGLGLTWSRRNNVADGSYFRSPKEGIRGGLTPFGIDVMRHADALGYFFDVSHLNDTGFSDLCDYFEGAFIASHSNTRTLNDIPRNLTDDQIRTISERGGVIGVNSYNSIVSQETDKQSLEVLCDHIEHIISVGGEKCVGLGFDLCTPYYDNGKQLDVLMSHEDTNKISEILFKRGHSNSVINQVLGENFLNFLMDRLIESETL